MRRKTRRSVPYFYMDAPSARAMRRRSSISAQRAGIPAVLVTGTVEGGEAHAWTAVLCSGSWYYAGSRLGGCGLSGGRGRRRRREAPRKEAGRKKAAEGSGTREIVDYGYFLVPSRELFRTHTPDVPFPLPNAAVWRIIIMCGRDSILRTPTWNRPAWRWRRRSGRDGKAL